MTHTSNPEELGDRGGIKCFSQNIFWHHSQKNSTTSTQGLLEEEKTVKLNTCNKYTISLNPETIGNNM
jgi:hypothetical protein